MKAATRFTAAIRTSTAPLALAAATLAAAAAPASAQNAVVTDQRTTFNIPAQPLSAALLEYSRQSGILVVVDPARVEGRQARAVKGRHRPTDALERMVAGTGLVPQRQAQGGFTLVEAPGESLAAGGGGRGREALYGRASLFSGEAEAAGAAADDVSADGRATPEILVIGTRSQNVDIRRSEDDAQPYVVFSTSDIEQSGATTLDQFLASRLPQNTQTRDSLDPGSASSPQGQINLRGLGTNQTLILVDGRRIPGVANQSDFNQPNVAGFPLSAIERIEVLPSTASAIYGGGATGGVINVVLRRDYRGIELNYLYGDTLRGRAEHLNLDISGGASFEGGRTSITTTLSHRRQLPFIGGLDRFRREAYERSLRNLPVNITPPSSMSLQSICRAASTAATAGCVSTAPTSPLTLDNGTSLGSAYTHVPASYLGPSVDGGLALAANRGTYHYRSEIPALSDARIQSGRLSARREMANWLQFFFDLSISQTVNTEADPVRFTTVLPGTSTLNPFLETIRISAIVPGVRAEVRNTLRDTRMVVGAIARLPWGLSASFEYGRARSRSSIMSDVYGGTTPDTLFTPAGVAFYAPLILSDPATWPRANHSELLVRGRSSVSAGLVLSQGSFRLTGPLMTLPGGPITFTGLVERRTNRSDDFYSRAYDAAGTLVQSFNGLAFTQFYPSARQDIWSYYLEGRVPLFSRANSRTLLNELELSMSVRHDRYRTVSAPRVFTTLPFPDDWPLTTNNVESTDYFAGIRYSPFSGITFRGSFGTGFLPPSIGQIRPATQFTQNLSFLPGGDPQRGGTPFPSAVGVLSGGNAALEPERSESLSFGIIFAPRFVPGLRFSVDYTQIRKRNEIITPFANVILGNADLFPGRVVRAPLTPADSALGYTAGPVATIDTTLININRSDVASIDYQLDYTLRSAQFGSWRFYAVASQALSRRIAGFGLNLFPTDDVGFNGGPLRWRGNGGVEWTRGRWTLNWNAQYYSGYDVCTVTDTATFCDQNRTRLGRASFGRELFHDFLIHYEVGGARLGIPLDNARLTLGVINAFGDYQTGATGIVGYADPRLRRFTVALRA